MAPGLLYPDADGNPVSLLCCRSHHEVLEHHVHLTQTRAEMAVAVAKAKEEEAAAKLAASA